jgi:hypothetical protein
MWQMLLDGAEALGAKVLGMKRYLLKSQVLREQELSERYLYPAMRMLVYLVYRALALLVRLPLFRARVWMFPSPESRVHRVWVRLRSRVQRQSVSQAWQEQQGLEASPQSQAIPLLFQWTRLRVILGRLHLTGMRMSPRQALARQAQLVRRIYGVLSTMDKRPVGQQLVIVRRRIGQLLMTVKHQIGKR